MKLLIMVGIILLMYSVNVRGQMTQAAADSMCSASAFIVDRDPNGLNVRSGPNGKSKRIGKIPFDKDGTMVTFIAAEGKWLKIKEVWNMEEKTVFSKTGWVYAPLLAITISKQDPDSDFANAYEMPSTNNKVVARLPVFKEFRLEGCFESWLKVTIPGKKGSVSGWVEDKDQCDLAQTNC